MFDYEHERALRMGANPDKALLATFRYEYDENSKEQVPYINIFLSKNTQVDRRATEDDFKRFPDRWEAFQKGEDRPPDGMPINQVPFATPANVAACKAEKIYTVEQLVETADVRLKEAHLVAFKHQCSDLMKQLKDSAHIVEMRETMDKLQSQLEALKETNDALREELDEERNKPRRAKRKSDGNASTTRKSGSA